MAQTARRARAMRASAQCAASARDFLGAPSVPGFESLADHLVQAPALRGRQALIDHLLVEDVTERVARARHPIGPGDLAGHAQDILAVREPVAQLLDDLDVGELAAGRRDGSDDVGREFRARNAGALEHPPLVGAQALEPRLDDGAHPLGDRRARGIAATQLPADLRQGRTRAGF